EKYSQALNEQRQQFDTQLEEMRDRQRENTARTREELNAAHRRDKELFLDYHNEKVGGLRKDLRTTRNYANQRLRQQELRHTNDKVRMEESHFRNARKLATDHNEIQAETREGYLDA